jgi:hypothetical protein
VQRMICRFSYQTFPSTLLKVIVRLIVVRREKLKIRVKRNKHTLNWIIVCIRSNVFWCYLSLTFVTNWPFSFFKYQIDSF